MFLITVIAVFGLMLSPSLITDTYGHGRGIDIPPPINFEGMDVTVSTKLDPQDLTVNEIEQPSIEVRFFDADTDEAFSDVTYRIEVWKHGDLLARDMFFSDDGLLKIDVRPVYDCDEAEKWRCTTYYGERDPISGGLIERAGQPPVIQGPIFDKGGLYHIKVIVEGATDRTIFVNDLSFDTYVSVAQEQVFHIDVPAELILESS